VSARPTVERATYLGVGSGFALCSYWALTSVVDAPVALPWGWPIVWLLMQCVMCGAAGLQLRDSDTQIMYLMLGLPGLVALGACIAVWPPAYLGEWPLYTAAGLGAMCAVIGEAPTMLTNRPTRLVFFLVAIGAILPFAVLQYMRPVPLLQPWHDSHAMWHGRAAAPLTETPTGRNARRVD
jgi:hypothetical protein